MTAAMVYAGLGAQAMHRPAVTPCHAEMAAPPAADPAASDTCRQRCETATLADAGVLAILQWTAPHGASFGDVAAAASIRRAHRSDFVLTRGPPAPSRPPLAINRRLLI